MASDGANCFRFSLHNSSFILAAQRRAVGFIEWLGLTHMRAAVTSRVGEQRGSHHQVAAVDVEGRAGNIAGGPGGGEANQIGHFDRGAEARHGIVRGETF